MGRVANPELASWWRDRIEGQQRSGLTVSEYCRRKGLSAGSFHAWKSRLRVRRSAAKGTSKKPGPQRGSDGPSLPGGFVRIPLAVEAAIEVRFVDGTIVSVPVSQLGALAVTLQTLTASQQREGAGDD